MKKILALSFLTLFLIASIAMVSAVTDVPYKTVVSGTVYDTTDPTYPVVPGAYVKVTCGSNYEETTTDATDGTYWVTFDYGECLIGSSLTIYGEKDELSGYNKDPITVHDISEYPIPLDVELGFAPGGDVFLIPEFGVFVGALTLLGAVGVFFLVRRK